MSEYCAVVDTHGLRFIASANNAAAIRMIASGCLRVPTAVWVEFSEIFEAEAVILKRNNIRMIQQRSVHLMGAAKIPGASGGGLSLRPYGNPDWLAGGVAISERKKLFTTQDRVGSYSVVRDIRVFRVQDISECVLCDL